MTTKTRSRKLVRRGRMPSGEVQAVRVINVGRERKLELREQLKMTREVFGRLVNVSVRTIATAEQNNTEVTKLKRSYTELSRLYKALSEVIESKAIGRWFETPNDAFGGLKPIEVVERGQIDRLWDMVFRLQTGMPG